MSLYVPRVYQPPMTRFAIEHERCNIFARMGAGKTPAMLEAAAYLYAFNEIKRTLVIAPKRVAQSTWIDELKQFKESFGHMSIAAAVGNPKQRLDAVKRNPDILCINYESVEWLIDGYGDRWPFDMVMADEAGALKGHRVGMRVSSKGNAFAAGQGSVRAAALARIAHKYVRRWVNLNGSPAPNGLQDLWGQMFFIDGGKRLGTSFSGFQDRYFVHYTSDSGYSKLRPLPYAKVEIEDAIRDVSLTVDPRPFLNARTLVEHHVKVRLPPRARKAYDEMQDLLFTEIAAGKWVEAFNSGGKVNKCLQIASGFAIHDSETRAWEHVHDEKVEALKSIVSEMNGESLLVRYNFVPEREMIMKAFPHFKVLDSDPKTIRDFQDGLIPGLVTHAKSAGHGLSLQKNCRTLIDFSRNFNLGEDEQIIERVGPTRQAQSGFDRDSLRYSIVAEDTLDLTSVIPVLQGKMSVQDSLLAAMQR